jgi:hypothetical protein
MGEGKRDSPNVVGDRWRSITGVLVVVQLCGDVMFGNLCLLGERFDDSVEGGGEGLLDCCTGHGGICLRG